MGLPWKLSEQSEDRSASVFTKPRTREFPRESRRLCTGGGRVSAGGIKDSNLTFNLLQANQLLSVYMSFKGGHICTEEREVRGIQLRE